MADKYRYDWRNDKSLFQSSVTTSDSAHWYDVSPNLSDPSQELNTEHRTADINDQGKEQESRLRADELLLRKFELEKQARENRIDNMQSQIDKEISNFNQKSDKDVEEWIQSHYDKADAASSRSDSTSQEKEIKVDKKSEAFATTTTGLPSAPPPYSELEIENLEAKSHYPVEFQSHKSVEGLFNSGIRLVQLNPNDDNLCWKCYSQIEEKAACADAEGNILHQDCYAELKYPKCEWCFYKIGPSEDKKFSGFWCEYEGKRYHRECYEKYSGPRCSVCFDVIITRPIEDFSGRFIQQNEKLYHIECFKKRKLAEIKARRS